MITRMTSQLVPSIIGEMVTHKMKLDNNVIKLLCTLTYHQQLTAIGSLILFANVYLNSESKRPFVLICYQLEDSPS